MRIFAATLLLGLGIAFIAAPSEGDPFWPSALVSGLGMLMLYAALALVVAEARKR